MRVTPDADLAIVGSGFGASILAMIARRVGFRVMLLERGRHPRFAIGESASPLAGILIEQLSDRYDLPRLRPLSAYGTWQRTYPLLVCGLKRGFTFFKHETGRPYEAAGGRANQLLVAASPSDDLSDTHWLRSDVDQFLLNEAVALGAEYVDSVALDGVEWRPDGDPVLVGNRGGQPLRVHARFVVDASGPRGFLSRALNIPGQGFDRYPATQALYSHFTGVARCGDMPGFGIRDSGSAESRAQSPPRASGLESRVPSPESRVPYPIDDAAVHHVFDGGWMWVLRFGNGVVSAGVAVEDWLAAELRLADGAPAWERLLARYPSVAAQFVDARPIREFTWMPRLAYRASVAAGERWAMLPSAAAFVDPLFSTGIPLTLLGIERLARIFEQTRRLKPALYGGEPSLRAALYAPGESDDIAPYGRATLAEADLTARLVAGSYAAFQRFDVFAAYAMFYFAAASYREMARRLGSGRAPKGFLCSGTPAFTDALERLSPARHRVDRVERYEDEVGAAIADWNIAGLCDRRKDNWYGVDLEDTIRSAAKLGLTPEQVRSLLAASTWS